MGKEQDALRVAALAAADHIRKTEEKLRPYREVIAAWEKVSGGTKLDGGPRSRREAIAAGLRNAPGQVKQHVRAILAKGGEYRSRDIVNAIAEEFGAVYSRATVVSILHRGRKQGLYVVKEGHWRLKNRPEGRG